MKGYHLLLATVTVVVMGTANIIAWQRSQVLASALRSCVELRVGELADPAPRPVDVWERAE